jgi:hypothetical protein
MFIVLVQVQSDGDDLTEIGRDCVLCQTEEDATDVQKQICDKIMKRWHGMECESCEESMYGHKSIFIDIEDTNGYSINYEIHIIEEAKGYK